MQLDTLELNIIKAIISNRKLAVEFVYENTEKLFSQDLWRFGKIIIEYIKNYKDVPTKRVLLEKIDPSKNEALAKYVEEVWDKVAAINYNDKEYHHDLEKLKTKLSERFITNLKTNLSSSTNIQKSISEISNTLQNIKGINNQKTYERKTLRGALPGFVERFNQKKHNPDFDKGIKTGYSFFDFATNGVKPADFVLVAGESGHGKSIVLNNMAIQMWLQNNNVDMTGGWGPGKNIVYFSLEMPYEDCFNRLLSRLSGVPSRKIENASVDKEEHARIKKALSFIKSYPYEFEIVDMVDASANDIDAVLDEIDWNVDTIVCDYLGIMSLNHHGSEDQDWLKQGMIAYELRAVGRKRNIPIFTAVQLNRKSQNATPENSIGLNRLARSATIATHATTVLQIEARPNEENFSDMVIHIIKNRKGLKGKFKLAKNLACASLIDIPFDSLNNSNGTDIEDISNQIEELEKLSI